MPGTGGREDIGPLPIAAETVVGFFLFMFHPSAKKFFLYALAIAGLEDFITQGVLKGSYVLWVFTSIPFVVFLGIAGCVRAFLHKMVKGRRAAMLYYVVTGGIGLAVEWFIIGLSPWSDRCSRRLLIALFHAAMFRFLRDRSPGPAHLARLSPGDSGPPASSPVDLRSADGRDLWVHVHSQGR